MNKFKESLKVNPEDKIHGKDRDVQEEMHKAILEAITSFETHTQEEHTYKLEMMINMRHFLNSYERNVQILQAIKEQEVREAMRHREEEKWGK